MWNLWNIKKSKTLRSGYDQVPSRNVSTSADL